MITTENLSLQIGNKTLLHPLSLKLETGKLHLILGPNGAGKSTLVKLLSGQQKPSSGTIFYDDRKLTSYKVEHLARFRAVLSQSVDFAFPLTVNEVVTMGRYPHFSNSPSKKDKEIISLAITLFEIENLANRDYPTLSGGEKQRVQFARIMAQIWPDDDEPKVLFLDEPLTYLDIKFQYDFLNLIADFLKKHPLTVIGVLHDLNLAARFADNLILLKHGHLIAHGKQTHVLTSENIERMYGMIPRIIEHNKRLLIDF